MRNTTFVILIMMTLYFASCEARSSSHPVPKLPNELSLAVIDVDDDTFEIRAFSRPNNQNDFVYYLYKDKQRVEDVNGHYIGTYHSLHTNKEEMIKFLMDQYKKRVREPFVWQP